ncbi:Chorismate synthase [subsurface metagenome]
MRGSEHNDPVISKDGKTATNHSGGINGGISNGNPLVFRVAVKPTSSISKKQRTINMTTGEMVDLEIKGRHDVCIALRVPVIVEAATAIVLVDQFLTRNQKPVTRYE